MLFCSQDTSSPVHDEFRHTLFPDNFGNEIDATDIFTLSDASFDARIHFMNSLWENVFYFLEEN